MRQSLAPASLLHATRRPYLAGRLLGALAIGSAALSVSPMPLRPASLTMRLGASLVRSSSSNSAGCQVPLADTSGYFEAPPPTDLYQSDLIKGVANHITDFGDRARVTFGTCDPKRVLFIGDSLAFTLAFGMLGGEQRYGTEIGGDPREGCSFNPVGLLLVDGAYTSEPAWCRSELEHWIADESAFHADAVVVELGWRDEFEWQVDGRAVGLGDAAFDTFVQDGIERLVQQLGQGRIPILFLTVPWAARVAEPNGSLAPQGSPQRHQLMNAFLEGAARRHPGEVSVLDIDRLVSPGDHYNQYVQGHLCRFDGIHFTIFCARLIEPYVLGKIGLMVAEARAPHPIVGIAATPDAKGYWLVDSRGAVYPSGSAPACGDLYAAPHDTPVVGLAATPDGRGYWLVTSGGGVFPFGDARYFGSAAGHRLSKPIVGIAATGDGVGYWLVAADGGIFSFGGARYRGSMGGKHLNAQIVGIAADRATGGYWLVGADGGVFSFGAPYFGSTGRLHLAKPIIEMESLQAGDGYRFVASDGGVFDFGAARFDGSLGGHRLGSPVAGMAEDPTDNGYWLVQSDGVVTGFGAA